MQEDSSTTEGSRLKLEITQCSYRTRWIYSKKQQQLIPIPTGIKIML